MIRNYLITILLFLCVNAQATHSLTYYVYLETEYLQGPWSRTDILESSGYKYLAPKQYVNLFGSVREDMVNTMIANLRENKPELYKWEYTVKVFNDTVLLTINEEIGQIETIKNEITSTLTLNSFSVVTFEFPTSTETLSIDDIKIPYLDLVVNDPKQIKKKQVLVDTEPEKQHEDIEELEEQTGFSNWFILSIGLNILLICFLLYRIMK